MKWLNKTWIIGFIVLLAASSAPAVLITIEIEGVVDNIIDGGNNFGGFIQSGSIITGYYSYDSDTSDSSPESSVMGSYLHSGSNYGMWLNIDGYSFYAKPESTTLSVTILNDRPRYENDPEPDDRYTVQALSSEPYENEDVVCDMFWRLNDPLGDALDSIALPDAAPILSLWPDNHLYIEGGIYDSGSGRLINGYEINAHITSAVVPEPCISIFLLGGAALLRKR